MPRLRACSCSSITSSSHHSCLVFFFRGETHAIAPKKNMVHSKEIRKNSAWNNQKRVGYSAMTGPRKATVPPRKSRKRFRAGTSFLAPKKAALRKGNPQGRFARLALFWGPAPKKSREFFGVSFALFMFLWYR